MRRSEGGAAKLILRERPEGPSAILSAVRLDLPMSSCLERNGKAPPQRMRVGMGAAGMFLRSRFQFDPGRFNLR